MILYLFLLNKGRYVVLFLNKGVWGYLKKILISGMGWFFG